VVAGQGREGGHSQAPPLQICTIDLDLLYQIRLDRNDTAVRGRRSHSHQKFQISSLAKNYFRQGLWQVSDVLKKLVWPDAKQ